MSQITRDMLCKKCRAKMRKMNGEYMKKYRKKLKIKIKAEQEKGKIIIKKKKPYEHQS